MMKVLFHNALLGKTGGAVAINDMAKSLIDRGHDVSILVDRNKVDIQPTDGVSIFHISMFGLKQTTYSKRRKADTKPFKENPTASVEGSHKKRKFWKKSRTLSKSFKWIKYILRLIIAFPIKLCHLHRFIKNQRPDLIISHNMYQDFEYLLYYKHKSEFYLMLHNSPEDVFHNRTLLRLMPIRKYLHSVKTIAVCHELAVQYESMFELNKNTTKVIYPPVNTERVLSLAEQPASGDLLNKRYICTVGSLGERKRIDRVIRAFAQLPDSKVQLYILGDGPLKSDLQLLCENLSVSDRVFFLGFIDNPFVYMKHADCLVHTADSEGLGLILVESLLLDTPVIALDCPVGPREILLGNARNGLVPMRGLDDYHVQANLTERLSKFLSEPKCSFTVNECNLARFSPNSLAQQFESLVAN